MQSAELITTADDMARWLTVNRKRTIGGKQIFPAL